MIGVRFSLYPMTDAFVPVILDAVQGLDRLGLEVEVDDVSTCLMGEEPQLFEALRVAFGRAARTGTHVVMVTSFSAGCPGEPEGDVCAPRHVTLAELAQEQGADDWVAEAYDLPERVACQFALYPLGIEHYMEVIYREIGEAKTAPVHSRGRHFATHLAGDGAAVFDALRTAFRNARRDAAHVVMTATISANSPSAPTV